MEEDEMGMTRAVGTLLGPPPNPVGVDKPGLRRLDEDTAGLVNLEEGWDETWPPIGVPPRWWLLWWGPCPLVSLWAIAAAMLLGCTTWTGGATCTCCACDTWSFDEFCCWTGVAVPEPDVGIKSSRHFFTKLLAREANCLSLALRRSSFMCLPNRVAWKIWKNKIEYCLTCVTLLINPSFLPSKWNLYLTIQCLA